MMADEPLIGYDNIVTTTNIAATSSATDYPVTRLANPETHLEWRSSPDSPVSPQYITVTTAGVANVEYIGVVGHNWGTDGATVSVEQLDSNSPPAYAQIVAPSIPDTDDPILWRLSTPQPQSFRIKIVPVSLAPAAAVVMAGSLLVMPQRIYSRHLPITYARRLVVSNGRSESGKFLGRVVLGEDRENVAQFRLITPEWFRDNIPDFLEAAKDNPFFFAWRPDTYPDEVGFCWLADDPAPMPEDPSSNNLIAFDLKMSGVA
jgi:hypothetical protein